MISVTAETFRFAETFTLSRGSRNVAHVLTVRVTRDGVTGWAECVPYARYDETSDSVMAQIRQLPSDISREALQQALPPGAARNAVDCALWDLEAKQTATPAWRLAGLPRPTAQITAFTLSLDSPENMHTAAAKHADRPLLKIKLGTASDLPRLDAVRAGAPQSRIIVDANEGWSPDAYETLLPDLVRLGIEMIEQPLPAGRDAALMALDRPIPVCADESCHDRAGLEDLRGKYDMINIKLDKTGGLTEALALREAAIDSGFAIMVGCMVGSSLAMAPAVLLAQGAAITDLDGPLLLAEDRDQALRFDAEGVHPSDAALWG